MIFAEFMTLIILENENVKNSFEGLFVFFFYRMLISPRPCIDFSILKIYFHRIYRLRSNEMDFHGMQRKVVNKILLYRKICKGYK